MAETRENIVQQITNLLRAIPTGKKISFAVVIAINGSWRTPLIGG